MVSKSKSGVMAQIAERKQAVEKAVNLVEENLLHRTIFISRIKVIVQ